MISIFSNNNIKRIVLSLGIFLLIVLIFGIYFIYTLIKVNQVKEKMDQIDKINQSYEVLVAFSGIESKEVSEYSKNKLATYNNNLRSLCSSQGISISDCSLTKLKLDNLLILDNELGKAIADVIQFESEHQ